MYKEGDYVHYANGGLCMVKKITKLNISGADRNRLYYCLKPVNDDRGTVFIPVDTKVPMRPVMTEAEADDLIDEIPSIKALGITDEKRREEQYKEALKSTDAREWVQVIKTLHERKLERTSQGRKITSTDERYLSSAKDRLYSELALALGKNKDDMEEYIEKRLA